VIARISLATSVPASRSVGVSVGQSGIPLGFPEDWFKGQPDGTTFQFEASELEPESPAFATLADRDQAISCILFSFMLLLGSVRKIDSDFRALTRG
jgi:hypothetical protein